MSKGYFKELKPYTLIEIASRLGTSDFQRLQRALSNHRYIIEKNDEYTFGYVGVLILGDFVFRCFPKYMEDNVCPDLENNFRNLMKVIKKYQSQAPSLDIGADVAGEYSFLKLAVALIDDYCNYGIYRNEYSYISRSEEGDILWDDTVNEITPITQAGRPFYDEPLTLEYGIDENHLLQQIHLSILFECSTRIKADDLTDLLGVPEIDIIGEPLSQLGDADSIINILNKELATQYNLRKQQLLLQLIQYVEHEYANSIDSGGVKGFIEYTYYGLESMWSLWEHVCKTVLDSDLEKKIEDLPLSTSYLASKQYKKVKGNTLLGLIEHPLWEKDDRVLKKRLAVSVDTYKPDGIIISQYRSAPIIDMRSYCFTIIDAKYYDFDIIESSSGGGHKACFSEDSSHPGLEDITKQFMYQRAYSGFINSQGYGKTRNVFICPSSSTTAFFGSVSFSIIQSIQSPALEDILVIKLDANDLYTKYLNNNCVSNTLSYLGI